jgi:hypothetical protein
MYVLIVPRYHHHIPQLISLLEVFGLPPDIISADLGDIGVVQVAQLESKVIIHTINRCSATH